MLSSPDASSSISIFFQYGRISFHISRYWLRRSFDSVTHRSHSAAPILALSDQKSLAQTLELPDHADGAALLAALQASPAKAQSATQSATQSAAPSSTQPAQSPGLRWLCTEKDAVKLFPLLAGQPGLELWAVPLEQEPAPEFWHQLDLALKRVRERLSFAHGRQTA